MKQLLTVVFIALSLTANAGINIIAQSPSFDEPQGGFAKILLLKNGNTAYIHITAKDGIDVVLFDKQHQIKANNNLQPDYGNLKAYDVEGVYEVGGDIDVFISEVSDKAPTLYRLIINGETGKLQSKATLGTLNPLRFGDGYAIALGGVPYPGFKVRKDPASDNYAIALFNSFESDGSKRVEVVRYNSRNEEIGRSFVSSPSSRYKYTELLDFVVIGDDRTYTLLYSYNTTSSGGAANELLLAEMNSGSEKVTYTNLGKAYAKGIEQGILKFDPKSNHLFFLTNEFVSSETKGRVNTRYYSIQFNSLDLNAKLFSHSIKINFVQVTRNVKQFFKGEKKFFGFPQNFYVNEDGTSTLILEEMDGYVGKAVASVWGGMGGFGQANARGVRSLGSLAVINYNEKGEEISTAFIPKSQIFTRVNPEIKPFYVSDRLNSCAPLGAGDQYKSFSYINGKRKSFVLVNDLDENDEAFKKGNIRNIMGVGDCDAYCYDISANTSGIPPRLKIFNAQGKNDHNLAVFIISDYDRENDVYATLKLDDAKKDKVNIVWLNTQQ